MAAMRRATLHLFWPELPRLTAKWKKPGSALKKRCNQSTTRGCWRGAISIWAGFLISSRTVMWPWSTIGRRLPRAILLLIPRLQRREVWRPHTRRGEPQSHEEIHEVLVDDVVFGASSRIASAAAIGRPGQTGAASRKACPRSQDTAGV